MFSTFGRFISMIWSNFMTIQFGSWTIGSILVSVFVVSFTILLLKLIFRSLK